MEKSPAEVGDRSCRVDGYMCEAREVFAAVRKGGEVANGSMCEEDEGDGLALYLSVADTAPSVLIPTYPGGRGRGRGGCSHFSSSLSFLGSKDSSQPRPTRTLTPPSSSRRDCDAGDWDKAPCSGQKLNMVGD